MYVEMKERRIEAGRLVKLADGRFGIVESIEPSPMANEQGIDRAYIEGVSKEFYAWALLEEIDIVYGVVESATTRAALTA